MDGNPVIGNTLFFAAVSYAHMVEKRFTILVHVCFFASWVRIA